MDSILATLNACSVDYLLIGGVNFMLRHQPVLTFDVDIWIDDTPENRARCVEALARLDAEWGLSEEEWGPIRTRQGDWLARQSMFSLTTREGPLDVFRSVKGLPSWTTCAARARAETTTMGTPYRGLSDADMLACQLALDESERKLDRVRRLTHVLNGEKR